MTRRAEWESSSFLLVNYFLDHYCHHSSQVSSLFLSVFCNFLDYKDGKYAIARYTSLIYAHQNYCLYWFSESAVERLRLLIVWNWNSSFGEICCDAAFVFILLFEIKMQNMPVGVFHHRVLQPSKNRHQLIGSMVASCTKSELKKVSLSHIHIRGSCTYAHWQIFNKKHSKIPEKLIFISYT